MEGERVTDDDRIVLSVPASQQYARVARAAVVGVATRSGLSFEEVEDLRDRVSDACRAVLADPDAGAVAPTDHIEVVLTVGVASLEVRVGLVGRPAGITFTCPATGR